MFRRPVLVLVALVALAVGWYLFRPELIFIDNQVSESFPEAPGEGTILSSGEFHGVAHETRGAATVHRLGDGTLLLRLTGFETSNGPDVHVYLSSASDAQDSQTVERSDIQPLGPMKGNVGDQNYQLPAGLDLDRYRSVVIWCKRFGVNFATAPLRKPEDRL